LRHAIITCRNAKHADFPIEHWWRSLAAQDNLSDGSIDLIVLDYGLTAEQFERLHAKKVRQIAAVSSFFRPHTVGSINARIPL
jgi:hypothetical protein